MNRDETITGLKELGAKLAAGYKFQHINKGEDRQKGIWGEALTEQLEKEHGPCTEEIKWFGDNPEEAYVKFDFRFSDPRLSVRLPGEVFASLELSDYVYETKQHDGNFRISEVMAWKEDGVVLSQQLLWMWKEYERKVGKNELSETIEEELDER